jgi:Lipid-binding putative hydrolase
MNRIFKISGIIILLFSISCTKKLENPGATNTVAMSNEWWVTLTLGGNDLLGAHVLFTTYNTSQNVSDSLWLDDLGNGYQFKCKVLADPKNLTFTTDSSQNEYHDVRVHIANGKIIPNGGHGQTTGSVVDSIYMEASFGDDPGDTYIISGVARSRWAQDDYH